MPSKRAIRRDQTEESKKLKIAIFLIIQLCPYICNTPLFPAFPREKPGKARKSRDKWGRSAGKARKKILSRWFPGKRELAKNLNFNIFFNAF